VLFRSGGFEEEVLVEFATEVVVVVDVVVVVS
jgi:hypothetical protein